MYRLKPGITSSRALLMGNISLFVIVVDGETFHRAGHAEASHENTQSYMLAKYI